MCEPLQLIEVRKTQRRVAALLQYHDADVYVPKVSTSCSFIPTSGNLNPNAII